MNEPIVKVVGLSHQYHIQWAIKNIDFELYQYGIYGLLGANGAGKSTIMNIVSGVLSQSHGDVFIKGVNIKDDPINAKKHIGFLPQKPPLLLDLTVEEYLEHTANLRLIPKHLVPTAINEVLEKCGLTHFRRRVLRNLSGGYQQRVGIAQAIIHKPSLVVFDEPTNGLDPNQILEVRKLIKEIAEEHTVILSTHILQEVEALCDTIWMIHEGSVVFSGSIDEFDNYISPTSVEVTLLANPSVEEIMELAGVNEVKFKGKSIYQVDLNQDQETLELFAEMCVNKKWRLTGLALEKKSLDAVFATLSKHESNK